MGGDDSPPKASAVYCGRVWGKSRLDRQSFVSSSRPIRVVKVRKSAKADFLLVVVAVAAVASTIYETLPAGPSINVQVTNDSQILDNLTISCFHCVPIAKDKWVANMTLAGVPLNTGYYGSGSSVGIKFGIGIGYQAPQGTTCSGYAINSTSCIRLLSLPFDFSFKIKDTSSAGTLLAIVYLKNGESFTFPASSSGLNGLFNFETG